MKTQFFEHYCLSNEKIKDIWQNGLVVFDTNVLLNLYRYNKETCDDILNYMKTFGDRLWMPYQVGWEYNNNRMDVAFKSQNACNVLSAQLDENRNKLNEFFKQNFHHHPYLQQNEFFKRYDRYTKLLKAYLEELQEKDNGYFDNDLILEKLGEIYEGCVGEDFNEDEYKAIFTEGKKRYAEKTPPGYKDDTPDKRAAGDRHLYGDFIIWKQIIKKASGDSKDVIFVSDDLKDDWILEFKGKKYGPRKELIKEFHNKTNQTILIYNQEKFLEYANKQLNASIKKETITEVKVVNQDILDFYREQIVPNLGQASNALSAIDAARRSLQTSVPVGIDISVFSGLEKYRTVFDSIQEQAVRLKAITEPISQINQNAHYLADIARRYSLETIPGWIPDSKTGLYFPPEKPGNNLDDKDADESGEDGLDK